MAKQKTRNKASNCISLCGKALDWLGLLTTVVAGSLPSSIDKNNKITDCILITQNYEILLVGMLFHGSSNPLGTFLHPEIS